VPDRPNNLSQPLGWICAVALGLLSFALNGVAVSAGWGVEFLFGSIVPFLALRVLSAPQVTLAASLGALRTVFIWNHPFAWLVWTLEAGIIALFMRRRSPVRVDLLFWLFPGAPLLWLTYGQILQLDYSSLRLLILKQALNGVLNVAVAEAFYVTIFFALGRSRAKLGLRPVSVESLLLSLMVTVAIVPAILFMRLDAANRQAFIEESIAVHLTASLQKSEEQLLQNGAASFVGPSGAAMLLVEPSGAMESSGTAELPPYVTKAGAAVRPGKPQKLIAPPVQGKPPMSIAQDTFYAQAKAVPGMPGWRLIAIASGSGEIARQRAIQARLLELLSGIVLAMGLGAFLLAIRSRRSLQRIGEAVADLAALGGTGQNIRELVLEEFDEIADRVASTKSRIGAERATLVANRRRLQSIAAHAPIIIYAVQGTEEGFGEVTFVSRSVEAVLGYDPVETQAPHWWESSLHPDDRSACLASNEGIQPGQIITQEYRIRHKLGHYVWVYDCLAVDEAENEAVGIMFDISERKLASEKLVLAGKMESLGRMAAGVAHELNQPLNFINIAAQNLKIRLDRGLLEADKVRDKLDFVLTQVQRAAAIVDQVRTFGRSDSGPPEQVLVDRVVRDVLDLMEIQLAVVDISLEYDCKAKSAAVLGQPARLAQVLINLILNARDAILAKRDELGDFSGRIQVRVYWAGSAVKIAVEDNGVGISPHQINMLFEPFFTTKPPDKGTGLGLSVSFGIVSDFGGTIRAENVPFGAQFVVALPKISTRSAGDSEA
jgi:PAS domain S-box-containing protein